MKNQSERRINGSTAAKDPNNRLAIKRSESLSAGNNTRQQGLGYLIRLAHRAFLRKLTNRLESHQITAAQWTTLRALWDEDGYSQVELAQRTHVEKASLTAVLDGLEKRGLAQRRPSAEDRRKWNVHLTKAGSALKKELLPYAAEVNTLASTGLSKSEVADLKRILQKITSNLT